MRKADAHACAINVILEMIRAGKAPVVHTGEANVVAEYQAEQIKLLHEKLVKYFETVET
ncbi:MAG: hypothetical protein ACLQVF_28885 [Isosphaeraceae bacterium]